MVLLNKMFPRRRENVSCDSFVHMVPRGTTAVDDNSTKALPCLFSTVDILCSNVVACGDSRPPGNKKLREREGGGVDEPAQQGGRRN